MVTSRTYLPAATVIAGAVILYALLSLVPHYNFRTHAYDLGIANQALHQWAHFQNGENTLHQVPNLWGVHLLFTILLFSPLYWLYGSYSLLIVQIIAVIGGGIGIYCLAKDHTKDEYLSIGAMSIFFLSFGVISAMIFEFHNNVLGMAFLPWLMLAWRKGKMKTHYLLLALLILAKETLALVGIFWGMSILLFEKKKRMHGVVIVLLSAVYFAAALYLIIPYFNAGQPYRHWKYGNLGPHAGSAAVTLVAHPLQSLTMFFNDDIKSFTWFLWLLSGGITAFLFPPYALLLIPELAQKFLGTEPNIWSPYFQYTIELAMITAVCLPPTLARFPPRLRYGLLVFFFMTNLSILTAIHGERLRLLLQSGYYHWTGRQALVSAIRWIPSGASVSAQDNFTPHLANRTKIYRFPEITDSEYIIFHRDDVCAVSITFLPIEICQHRVDEVFRDSRFRIVFEKDNVVLLRRVPLL